jgi:hypothetical protein
MRLPVTDSDVREQAEDLLACYTSTTDKIYKFVRLVEEGWGGGGDRPVATEGFYHSSEEVSNGR